MPEKNYTLLALGDSYTIGEMVVPKDNFPNQTVQLLKKTGFSFQAPAIVAKTGWTTNELKDGIAKAALNKQYDYVSLLIGVNNQYQGKSLDEYSIQFEELLKLAVKLAGNNASHVTVLSIPDWGATPFAEGRDKQKISSEIDAFNAVNKSLARKYKIHYIDITPGTRKVATDMSLLVADKLHPSAKEYRRWAKQLAETITKQLQ